MFKTAETSCFAENILINFMLEIKLFSENLNHFKFEIW